MYENIAKNRAKTVLIIICFVFFISMIGYFIGVYFDYRYGFGSTYSVVLMIAALLIAMLGSFGSYYYSDRIVLAMTGARPISRSEDPRVYYMVEGLSIAAGLPMPQIYMVSDTGMHLQPGEIPEKE